jgi:hypothetical protein
VSRLLLIGGQEIQGLLTRAGLAKR